MQFVYFDGGLLFGLPSLDQHINSALVVAAALKTAFKCLGAYILVDNKVCTASSELLDQRYALMHPSLSCLVEAGCIPSLISLVFRNRSFTLVNFS